MINNPVPSLEIRQCVTFAEGFGTGVRADTRSLALSALLANGQWVWHNEPYGGGISLMIRRGKPAIVRFVERREQGTIQRKFVILPALTD